MKKTPQLIFFVLFSLFFFSKCTDLLTVSKIKEQSNYIPLSESQKAVEDLLSIIDAKGTKSNDVRTISNSFSIGAKTKAQGGPIYHIFNFSNNKGYAIASSDRRTVPVFCIIDDGNVTGISDIQNSDNPIFKGIFADIDLYYRLKTGEKVYDKKGNEVSKDVLFNRFGYLMRDMEDEDTIECFYPEGDYVEYQAWQPKERFGNVIPTKWGQQNKFNKYCYSSLGNKVPAGCVAVAVGQIMAFHKYNTTYNGHVYNWSLMDGIIDTTSCPNDTVAWNKVAHLLSDLGRTENLDIQYDNGSGSDSFNAPRTFGNFGYNHTGTYIEYEYSASLSQKLNHGPVLIGGFACDSLGVLNASHVWIVDEEVTRRRRVRYNYQSDNYTEVYQEDRVIHMNLGWYGNANGYYHPDCLNVGAGPINFRNDSTIYNTGLDITFNAFIDYYYDIY